MGYYRLEMDNIANINGNINENIDINGNININGNNNNNSTSNIDEKLIGQKYNNLGSCYAHKKQNQQSLKSFN